MEDGVELKKFTIPTRDDDLVEANDDFYTVELQPTLEEIEAKIFNFRRHIEVENWKSILDYFDYLFFCVRFKFDGADPWPYRTQLLPLLTKGLASVLDCIENLLPILVGVEENVGDEHSCNVEREQHLRAMQMFLYLLCRIGTMFETESLNKQKDAAFATTKKGGRKAQYGDNVKAFVEKWTIEREKVMDVLLKMVTMTFELEGQRRYGAIRFLWLPPIVCPNLLRLIKEFAFKLLENPELCKVSYRQWLYTIFEFLHSVAVYFDDYQKVGSKLVYMMKHMEYLAAPSLNHSPFVEAIEYVCRDDDMDPLLLSMLNALGRFSATDFARNEVSARPFALFITSLAEKKPQFLNRNVVQIVPFLSEDQATLRCSVLTAFYEIVTQVYKGNLSEGPLRQARDRLLLCLQDHIVDVNAVVRSRALQLWTRLARASQIPLSFVQNCLIHDASSRLLDKSVFVRKNAAVFLSTFLTFNPFGPSLSSDTLKEKLNELYAEYNELKKQDPEYDIVRATMKDWEEMQQSIQKCIIGAVKRVQEEIAKTKDVEDNDSDDFVEDSAAPSATSGDGATETNSEKADEEEEAEEKAAFTNILSGRWEEAMVPFIENEETRAHSIGIFVRAIFDGKLSAVDVNVDGSSDEIVQQLYDTLKQAFLEKNVSKRLHDDEELIMEEDKKENFDQKLAEVEKRVNFCQEALVFTVEMENCLQLALRAVMTGQANELAETIKLVVEANKFGIKGSSKAVREMFRVVWKHDNAVQEVLVNAARDLFVSCNEKRGIAARKTAENLFKVVLGVNEEERVSIEQVIYLMVQKDLFDVEIYDLIAEVMFSACGSLRVAALRLFSIICKAKKSYMQERFDIFVELSRREGFFEGDDGSLAAEFFNLISMFGTLPNMANLLTMSRTPFRLPDSHELFECIHTLLLQGFTVDDYRWIEVMMKGLNAIFYVDAQPSMRVRRLAGDLVRLCKVVLAEAIKAKKLSDELNVDGGDESVVNDAGDEWDCNIDELVEREEEWLRNNGDALNGAEDSGESASENVALEDEELQKELLKQLRKQLSLHADKAIECWDLVAERLCFFAGEVALKLLIHVDISFVAEMKRKNEVLHSLRTASMRDPTAVQVLSMVEEFPADREPTELEIDSMRRIGLFEATESENEDRLGLTGMSEEERIGQRAQQICERDLLQNDALLGRLLPFIFHILEVKKCCSRERVRSAAALALAKTMLLSGELCERAMPFFIHYLTNSPSAVCRSNLMIAAGDICFRFPNILELSSEHLYNRINDRDDYVRRTCLIVLTHLILNDMIKVRTSIADLAKCTIDEDDHVAELANYLFAELSKKGNIIYNLMPDMISRLSGDDDASLDEFTRIMKILMSFIKKDKHSDNLLEKLCARLQTCIDQNGMVDERLAERISFCISRLPLSEKSCGIFTEQLPAIAHLLHLDSVYTNLHAALSSFKRTAMRNAELRSELDDLLEELTKLRSEKTDQQELADKAFFHARKKALKTPKKTPMKKKSKVAS